MTFAELRADVVILACAISCGIHAALTPDHFREGTPAGLGFAVSTVALAAIAVDLTRRTTQRGLFAAAAVFAGLIVAYAFAASTGIPVLHPDREPVDALALFTKAVEAIGLVVAASQLRAPSLRIAFRQPRGTLT